MSYQRVKNGLDMAASLAVIVTAGVVLWLVLNQSRTQRAALEVSSQEGVADVGSRNLEVRVSTLQGSKPAAAKVAVIEFSDFECPFCERYARETLPRLRKEFVDPGKAGYFFRQFPIESIHPDAMRAASYSVCSDQQGRFWQMHDLLFSKQRELPSLWPVLQQSLALDKTQFDACLQRAPSSIRQNMSEHKRLGVSSTPTFLLGVVAGDRILIRRQITGARPFEVFERALDELLMRETGT